MPAVPDEHRLSLRQVAEYLGVTPQRVCQLRARPDFPEPRAAGFRESTWSGVEIERWADAYPCGSRRWGVPGPTVP